MYALHSPAVSRIQCGERDGAGVESPGGRQRCARAHRRRPTGKVRICVVIAGKPADRSWASVGSGSHGREDAFGRGGEEPGQRRVRHRPGEHGRRDGPVAGEGRPGRPRAGGQRGHLRAEPGVMPTHLPGRPAGRRLSPAGHRRARLVPGESVARGGTSDHAVQQQRLQRPGTGGRTAAGDPAAAAEPRARLAALQRHARVLRAGPGEGAPGRRTGAHRRRTLRRGPGERGRGRRRERRRSSGSTGPSRSSSRSGRTSSRRRGPA